MHQQVPMVFLLFLVCLSTVYYKCVENSMGLCWHKDILRVKGLHKPQNQTCFKLLQLLKYMCKLCPDQISNTLWKFTT